MIAVLLALAAWQPVPPMRLVRCAAGSSAPCGAVDIRLGAAATKRLVELDSAALDDGWRASLLGAADLAGVGRLATANGDYRILVLLDVSGSMKGSKIGAARLVLRQFLGALDSLPTRSLRVAIAPFGSIDVADRIESAPFDSPDSARFSIGALPAPSRENTALFSATALGARRLATEINQSARGATGLLVVITDGDNDVAIGDDPDLLTGADGLAEAAKAVSESGVWVGIVGIGSLTRRSLESLAGDRGFVYSVSATPSAYDLNDPLTRLRRVLLDRWSIQLPLGSLGRAGMGRQWGIVAAELTGNGARTPVGSAVWRPPLVALPAFSRPAAGSLPDLRGLALAGGSTALAIVLPIVFVALVLVQVWVVLPRVLWPGGSAEAAGAAGLAGPAGSGPGSAAYRSHREAPPRKPTEITADKGRRK